jgi:hypothetical protein
MAKILMVLFVACGLQMSALAQENSPYSRYGLGDLTPNHPSFTRGMGGIAAGVIDNNNINFVNPASLASMFNTILDIGTDIDYRTLKSSVPAKKFTAANTYVSYLQLAFPLSTPKMIKKNMFWGMSLGLKPVTKSNYKIEKNERNAIDSLNTLYEGSGGTTQAFVGTGLKIGNLSFGINAGYMFGSKDISTKLTYINDSTFYAMSNSEDKSTFGGLFINGGLQYDIVLKKDSKNKEAEKILRLGLYGNLQNKLKASNDKIRETIIYDQNGTPFKVDSVYENNVRGNIIYPAMAGLGFTYQDLHWLAGADFEYGNWAAYRYYGQKDNVQDNWKVRVGMQYYPAQLNTPVKKYFNFVKYRAGIYYGSDYINTNKNRPEYGFTIGTGMPLTSLKKISYSGEYAVLNTGLEFSNRGNKQTNLRENVFRVSIGIALNARWFQKPKYN